METSESQYLLPENKFNVHTVGIHSCRFNTFEIIDEGTIVYPCGVFLQKYCMKENKVVKKLRISNSVITTMRRSFYYLVVSSYNGETAIIDLNSFILLTKFKLENVDRAKHVCISSDMKYICISCDYYKNENGDLLDGAVYIFNRDDKFKKDNYDVSYKKLSLLKIRESVCEFSEEEKEKLVIFEKNIIDINQPKKSSNYYYTVRSYDPENNFAIITEKKFENHNDEITTHVKCGNYVALSYSKRVIKVFDLITMNFALSVEFEGAGSMGAFDFKNNQLFVTNISERLLKLDITKNLNIYEKGEVNGEENIIKIPRVLPEDKSLFDYSIHLDKNDCIKQLNYVLRLDDNMEHVFLANEYGFFCIFVGNDEQINDNFQTHHYKINLPSLVRSSGCGVTINAENNLIAVGDLERNITIFNAIWEDIEGSPHLKEEDLVMIRLQTKDPIRSVHWDEKLNKIFIGTMGGKVFQYNSAKSKITQLADLKQTVTCLKVYNVGKNWENSSLPILIVGTTGGNVYIYQIESENLHLFNIFIAHPPQPGNTDPRFGSLKKKAEIWSLTSFPDTKHKSDSFFLITSSEDQTIKIWEFVDKNFNLKPKLLFSFKNHDMAVTSVDWKPMKVLNGEVLASCSDDKSIQIYDPLNNFELVKTLKTDGVIDWHTITYLSLEEDGTHLAVSTLNGFVVIFSLETWQPVFCEKLHVGGVEGLCWKKNLLVSCASDLNLGIIKFV